MVKKVVTNVTMITVNEVEEDEAAEIMERHDTDDFSEVAASMESQVEQLLATRMFGDADEIPLMDVSTEVEESED